MNLSDTGDVQQAEAALQLAVFSLGSRSREEEEENNDDDGMPPGLLPVSWGADKGSPEGVDRDAGALVEDEDGDELAAAPDELATPQDDDSLCITRADSAMAGNRTNVW